MPCGFRRSVLVPASYSRWRYRVCGGTTSMSSRRCFALDLVADAALIHEYCQLHKPGSVWPEVIDHIRAQGIDNMEIWRCGNRLFMIVEAADDYPRRISPASAEANEQWEAFMSRFQQKLP